MYSAKGAGVGVVKVRVRHWQWACIVDDGGKSGWEGIGSWVLRGGVDRNEGERRLED